MKPNRWNRFIAAFQGIFASSTLVVAFIGLSAATADSATLTWDISPGTVGGGNGTITGGAGTWSADPALGNWTVDEGATNVAWVNHTVPDVAIFSGTAGTVTQADVVVNQIRFASGYTIADGTLTLAGNSPTITADVNATISSVLGGTNGMVKDGSAILNLSTKATYTGGTTINAGILNLAGGGGETGTIRGPVTVNNGGILRFSTGDATGWGTNPEGGQVNTISVNQGSAIHVNTTANQTLSHAVITLTGGAITGVSGSNLDFFQGNSAITSRASAVTSTANGTRLSIRQTPGLTITVEKGTTPSGIDLDVGSVIASNGSFGTAPLIKAGDGTLLLRAANTYTGPTNINGGSFILGSAGTAPASDFTVNNGSTLRLASTGKTLKSLTLNEGSSLAIAASKTSNTTITNSLSINGAVTLKPEFVEVPTASDVYTLATAATSSGTPNLSVDLSSFGETRIAATAALVGNALQLTINSGAADLVWNNAAATGIWNHNAAANFSNGGTADVFKTYDGVTFDGAAPGTITLVGSVHPSAVTVNSSSGNYTFAGGGSLTGGVLTKSGSSALTLENSNSHPATLITGGILNANAPAATGGLTTVNGGQLNLGRADALGAGTLILNSGTFDNTSGAAAILPNLQLWNGSFNFAGTNNLTTSGAITLAGNSQVSVDAGSLITNGLISGAFNLSKAGAGILQLNAPHTYSGTTSVSGPGRLWVSNTLRNTASITVGSGSTLELGATNIFVGGHGTPLPNSKVITVNGGTLLMNTATDTRFGNVTLNDAATWTSNRGLGAYDALMANTESGAATISVGGTGTSVMNGSGGIHLQDVQNFVVADTTSSPAPDLLVNMILAGPGTLAGADGGVNKTGAGTMVLNAANTYLGATQVNEGTLQIGASGSASGSSFSVNASTLQIDATEKTLDSLTVTGGSILAFAAQKEESIHLTGALTTSGAITLRPLFTDVPTSGDTYDYISAETFVNDATYLVDMTSRGATRVTATASTELDRYLTLTINTGAANLVWNNGAGTNVWNLNSDANFSNGGTSDVFKAYDGITFGNANAGTVNLVGELFPGLVTIDSTADYTFGGTGRISSGQLIKNGSSTLNLTTAQSPAGVTLNAGIINVTHANALGTGTLVFNGGTLNNGIDGNPIFQNGQQWQSAVTFTGESITFGTAGVSLEDDTNVIVGPNDATLNGAIAGNGFGIVKQGAGTLHLNAEANSSLTSIGVEAGSVAVNTASGAGAAEVGGGATAASLVIDGNQSSNRLAAAANVLVGSNGTVTVAGVNALPNHANSINFTVEAGGVLNFISGGSPAIGAEGGSHHHIGDVTLNGGSVLLPYSGAGTAYNGESVQINRDLTVGGSIPSTIAFGTGATPENAGLALNGTIVNTFIIEDVTDDNMPDLTITAEIENSDAPGGSLAKEGAGTLLLAGDFEHTYTGLTTVSEGTLAVTGSLAGPLQVDADGTIAPGNGTGSFEAGATVLTGTYAYQINGAESDHLTVNGDLDLTGAILDITDLGGGATRPTYIVASYTGSLTGNFETVNSLPAGYILNHNDALKRIELTSGADPFLDWATTNGIGGESPTADSDGDGIANAIEFVIGGDPSGPDSNSSHLLPTTSIDNTHLTFTFRRTEESASFSPVVEYGSTLTGWTQAQQGVNGIVVTETDNGFGAGTDRVEVKIPRSLATESRIFARLKVTP